MYKNNCTIVSQRVTNSIPKSFGNSVIHGLNYVIEGNYFLISFQAKKYFFV